MNEILNIPLLPLRGITVFPNMVLHFDVTRARSISALEEAMAGDQLVLLVTQRDVKEEDPEPGDLYEVGTVSRVKQLLKLPQNNVRVLVEGLFRAKVVHFHRLTPYFDCEAEIVRDDLGEVDVEIEALMRRVGELTEEYLSLNNRVAPEALLSVSEIRDPSQLADVVASHLMVGTDVKQEIMDLFDVRERLLRLVGILMHEIEILEIERKISGQVKKQIDQNQKEYYLREQMKAIQSELGTGEDVASEVDDYKARMEELGLPSEVKEKLTKELARLLKLPFGTPEGGVIRTYVDTVLELPWNRSTQENLDLSNAKRILNRDHFGMEKVKERILEYLAVRKLTDRAFANILCLVGPPGVGKTSIARSVAEATGRNYVRLSLGGVRDEAEIRGHRKTYVGAMPGRIINAMIQAGSKNPLILLDEIDKMSADFRGDPAAALLEVLDAEQNMNFRDHYIELPFDLSQVMFIMTANSLDTVPRPLLDRMEVIELSSYTQLEKFQIARKYLIPEQVLRHGLKRENVRITDAALNSLIEHYTREAGVRSLERQIANICRKCAKVSVENEQKTVSVSEKNLAKFVGPPIFQFERASRIDQVGVATGLAWTAVGGDTMSIEVNVMDGSGKLELTGQLGDVMKESARAAVSYIRANATALLINPNFHKNLDIHIHVPEGAIPKDGPSAGITMACALVSALTGQKVRHDVAMTGEITIRGRVLPIGGLKEKTLAAYRAGITRVIVPQGNQKDLAELPEIVRENIRFITVSDMETVLKNALVSGRAKKGSRPASKEREELFIEPAKPVQPGMTLEQ